MAGKLGAGRRIGDTGIMIHLRVDASPRHGVFERLLTLPGRHGSKGRKLLLDIVTAADGTGHLCYGSLGHRHNDLEYLVAFLALEFVNWHFSSPF